LWPHNNNAALVALVFILKLQECVQCCYASIWSCLCQVLKREPVRWCEILKISLFGVLFVHSWVQGKGNTSPWLGSHVVSPWGIRYPTKVSFKNAFSFRCFYSHCTCPPFRQSFPLSWAFQIVSFSQNRHNREYCSNRMSKIVLFLAKRS
jgi:hypothetical protein